MALEVSWENVDAARVEQVVPLVASWVVNSTSMHQDLNGRDTVEPSKAIYNFIFSINPKRPCMSTNRRPFRSRYLSTTETSVVNDFWLAIATALTSSIALSVRVERLMVCYDVPYRAEPRSCERAFSLSNR